jgi:hypothetical protein
MGKALFATALLVILPLAFGQGPRPLIGKDIAVPSPRFPAEWYPKETGMNATAPIADAPYSATMTTTTKALDSEGKTVGTSIQRTLEWRDSAGRFRDEELLPEIQGQPGDAFAGIPHQVTAVDTVHHCQFTWSEPVARDQSCEAVVYCNSMEVSRSDDSHAKQMTDPKPEVMHEQLGNMAVTTTTTPLGKRNLEGLEAVGFRSVRTQVDAKGKVQSTAEGEIWWSPELYEILSTTLKTHEIIMIMELSEIRRDEPDAALFYPPKDCSIRKEAEVPPLPTPPQP